MYDPPPPRPRKTEITRSRAGCIPCRQKKRKCDETKPRCKRCAALGIACWFQPRVLQFRTLVHTNSSRTCHDIHYPKVNDEYFRGRHWQLQLPLGGPMLPDETYVSYFTERTIYFLPNPVRPVASKITEIPSLREAIIAFSAARLAYADSDPCSPAATTSMWRRLYRQHFHGSLHHFILAIHQIRTHTADVEDMLAAAIFFSFWELEVGTIAGFHCHVMAIEALVLQKRQSLMASPYGRVLLRAGIFLRARACLLFSPLQRLNINCDDDKSLDHLWDGMTEPQELIFISLVKAVILTTHLLLLKCTQSSDETSRDAYERILMRYTSIYSDININHRTTAEGLPDVNKICEQLTKLKQKIQDLFLNYSFCCDGAIQHSRELKTKLKTDQTNCKINPMIFCCHEDAINYAIYALTQIYTDEEAVRLLFDRQNFDGQSSQHINYWANVILRIAEGYSAKDLLCDRVYNINLCWLLILLATRWPTREIVSFLAQNLRARLQNVRCTYEDSAGSRHTFLSIVNILESLHNNGRTVFMIHPIHHQSTDQAYFLANNIAGYVVHGQDENGHFFNDYVSASASELRGQDSFHMSTSAED